MESERQKRKKQISPATYHLKGPVVVNGKFTPKGKSSAKGQTEGQVKGLMMQSQAKDHKTFERHKCANPSASAARGDVTINWDQHDGKACCLPTEPTCWVSQPIQSGSSGEGNEGGLLLLMAQVSLPWTTEFEYQHVLALRCAAGLQFSPLPIAVTSPIISHVMSERWSTQQKKGCYQCWGKPFGPFKCNRIHGTWRMLTGCAGLMWLSLPNGLRGCAGSCKWWGVHASQTSPQSSFGE